MSSVSSGGLFSATAGPLLPDNIAFKSFNKMWRSTDIGDPMIEQSNDGSSNSATAASSAKDSPLKSIFSPKRCKTVESPAAEDEVKWPGKNKGPSPVHRRASKSEASSPTKQHNGIGEEGRGTHQYYSFFIL